MKMLSSITVIYFISVSWISIDCQLVQYTLQKTSWEVRPNEQPLLLLGRKQSHPAIPQLSGNIPQIEYRMNEEVVVSCPESSTPGEALRPVTSSVDSAGTGNPAETGNQPDPAVTSGEDSKVGQTVIFNSPKKTDAAVPTEDESRLSETIIFDSAKITDTRPSNVEPSGGSESPSNTGGIIRFDSTASSNFDSMPHSPGASLPKIAEGDEAPSQPKHSREESNEPQIVLKTVTKKKAKFYASDIKFSWELPYLKCERPAQAVARKMVTATKNADKLKELESCKDNGEMYEVGFWVKGHKTLVSSFIGMFRRGKKIQSPKKEYEWHSLISVCFNTFEWRPVFIKYTLYGSAVKAAAKLMMHPNNFDYQEPFRPYDKVDPTLFYDKVTQYNLFEAMFGKDMAYTYNDTVSKFLIPLQLVAPAEMPTPLSTLATFSFLTTTPSWEVVALRNWRILTNLVLSFADEEKDDLVIHSGTAHLLQLQGIDGANVDMRLEFRGNNLAIPKLLYKFLYNKQRHEAIIFFIFNNPYVPDSSYQICVRICEAAGWYHEFWDNIDRGYTICCTYEEVQKSFPSLPQLNMENVGLLSNNLHRPTPPPPKIHKMDESFHSASEITLSADVSDEASTSQFRPESVSGEVEVL